MLLTLHGRQTPIFINDKFYMSENMFIYILTFSVVSFNEYEEKAVDYKRFNYLSFLMS